MNLSIKINRLITGKWLAAGIGALLCLYAVQSQGALTVDIMSGYNLVVDSNITSPSTYGPSSAYIGANVCNTGDTSLENVFVYVGDYANNTPGIFSDGKF